jgi:hypothetical protein
MESPTDDFNVHVCAAEERDMNYCNCPNCQTVNCPNAPADEAAETTKTDDTKQSAGVPRMGLMGFETWTPYGQRRDSDGAQVVLARSSRGYPTEFPHYEWATMPLLTTCYEGAPTAARRLTL